MRVPLFLRMPTFGGGSTVEERGVVLSTLNACDLCLRELWGPTDLRGRPTRTTLDGMDTSTTPYISPALEPETMTALMLRYVDGREEVADQYLRALLRFFMVDLYPRDAFKLVRDIVTESTNDIRTFENEEVASRIDVALRQLIDRAEADEVFMAELAKRAEWGC